MEQWEHVLVCFGERILFWPTGIVDMAALCQAFEVRWVPNGKGSNYVYAGNDWIESRRRLPAQVGEGVLKQLGADGWEAVDFWRAEESGTLSILFKRPVRQPTAEA
jgi:hypothetical protein